MEAVVDHQQRACNGRFFKLVETIVEVVGDSLGFKGLLKDEELGFCFASEVLEDPHVHLFRPFRFLLLCLVMLLQYSREIVIFAEESEACSVVLPVFLAPKHEDPWVELGLGQSLLEFLQILRPHHNVIGVRVRKGIEEAVDVHVGLGCKVVALE